MFRGTEVAVKRLVATSSSKDAVDEFMLETAIMWYVVKRIDSMIQWHDNLETLLTLCYSGLRHPNIVLFMGSSFDPLLKEMMLVLICYHLLLFFYSFLLFFSSFPLFLPSSFFLSLLLVLFYRATQIK